MKVFDRYRSYRRLGQRTPGRTDSHRADPETNSTAIPRLTSIDGHATYTQVFLQRRVLLALAILFVTLAALVQFLYYYSQNHQGISTTDQSRRYLWTSGPTAVFVLITVFWRQVDYAAKIILPWANMAKGPCSLDRSILLDYVSPFQLVTLWRSLRNRDWLISLTILIFFLLKILTIVSTGLFNLEPVHVELSEQDMVVVR